eukprot:jgi/Orpsp1_1/1180015/evm.model.c7180000071805.1
MKERELENIQVKPVEKQIHPSILAQPNIQKEKVKEKEIRDRERAETSNIKGKEKVESTKEDDPILIDDNVVDKSIPVIEKLTEENNSKSELKESKHIKNSRHIQMMSIGEEYNVINDLNNTKSNITFGQLFNVSPKVRTQVSQGLKLEKPTTKISGALDNIV